MDGSVGEHRRDMVWHSYTQSKATIHYVRYDEQHDVWRGWTETGDTEVRNAEAEH